MFYPMTCEPCFILWCANTQNNNLKKWTVAPALNLIWPNFCQGKNAFLRQFEPFICLTKLPQFLILHIFCRNDMVRCIILCSKLYLSIIKSNAVAIYIPAALFVLSSHKHQRHWIQSFWDSYQQVFPLIVTLGSNLPLGISPIHLNEIDFWFLRNWLTIRIPKPVSESRMS